MFRVYLRDPDLLISEKTLTQNAQEATAAFDRLVSRKDLDGTAMIAVLTRHGSPVAYHRFDASPQDAMYYWRGRVAELPIHESAGRPAEIKSGRNISVYLDNSSIETARRIGDGNVSEGIRLATRIAAKT